MLKAKYIAEIGKTHGGNMANAKLSIKAAKRVGFDYVKFQAYLPEDLINTHANYERYKNSCFNIEQLRELKCYATENNIGFYCSAFSQKILAPLSEFTNIIKVPSTFLTNDRFVRDCIYHFPVCHVSTGLYNSEIVKYRIDYYNGLMNGNAKDLKFYACTSMYPTPDKLLRLNRIAQYKMKGFSYHGKNALAIAFAIKEGAEYIELHFNSADSNDWTWDEQDIEQLFQYIEQLNTMYPNSSPSDVEIGNLQFYKGEYKDLLCIR